LQLSVENPDALALKGEIQFLQGDTSGAVATFQKLVEINNVSPLAYKFLSNALSAANDQNGAELAAKRASN